MYQKIRPRRWPRGERPNRAAPGGAANPDLISGIVNFVFALNCTAVNLKPLNGMSIQLAEVTHSRYESIQSSEMPFHVLTFIIIICVSFVPPLMASLKSAKSAATLTVLNLSSIYGKGARKSSKPSAIGPTRSPTMAGGKESERE